MLDECLEVFESILREKTEDWLLDNYIPKDGTYAIISIDNGFSLKSIFDVKVDKKTGNIQGATNVNYKLVSYLDYYSKLIEMNKPMDSFKTIHSNNIFAFFVKKESIQLNKLSDKVIDGYYSVLSNPRNKYTKSNARIIYEETEQEIGPVDTNIISDIQLWIENNLTKFVEENSIDTGKKDYLKIFFVYEDEEKTKLMVKNEGKRYLLPNIYNSNDYNQKIGKVIYGLPGNNLGLNSKKPYLENKSRKTKIPYILESKRALLQSQFFDYLSSQAALGKYNIYIDLDTNQILGYSNNEHVDSISTGIYMRIQQDKNEVAIQNVERIVDFNPNMSHGFIMREVVKVKETSKENSDLGYGLKNKLYEIEGLLDYVFFGKKLKYNYYTKPEDISITDSELKNIIINYRESLWRWFYTNDSSNVKGILDKMSCRIIKNSINNGYFSKAQHQLNLWVSLKEYLENNRRFEENMVMAREILMKHINSKEEWDFDNVDEYYYAVGQLAQTYLSLTKSKKRDLSLINPILNATKDDFIKQRLAIMFKKYSYAIGITDIRTRALIGHVMGYIPKEKANEFMIIAGFTDKNLVYTTYNKVNE